MGYQIKDKQLYKDGVKVRLEFGNDEQIKFLAYANKFYNDGLELDVDTEKVITVYTNFKCLCGDHRFYIEQEGDDFSDEYELIDTCVVCPKCKTKYVIEENENKGISAFIKKEQ